MKTTVWVAVDGGVPVRVGDAWGDTSQESMENTADLLEDLSLKIRSMGWMMELQGTP